MISGQTERDPKYNYNLKPVPRQRFMDDIFLGRSHDKLQHSKPEPVPLLHPQNMQHTLIIPSCPSITLLRIRFQFIFQLIYLKKIEKQLLRAKRFEF